MNSRTATLPSTVNGGLPASSGACEWKLRPGASRHPDSPAPTRALRPDGDAGPWRQPAQHCQRDRLRVGQHQHVGELGLADRHLGHRPSIRKFVVAERLRQPSSGVDTGHYGPDPHVEPGRSVRIARTDPDPDVIDRPADRLGLQPRRQVHHDPVHLVTAVQLAQQHQQVVANGAGHTAVRQLQRLVGGGEFTAVQRDGRPFHHVAVEAVLDHHRPRPAQQRTGDAVGFALTYHQNHRRPHPPAPC